MYGQMKGDFVRGNYYDNDIRDICAEVDKDGGREPVQCEKVLFTYYYVISGPQW